MKLLLIYFMTILSGSCNMDRFEYEKNDICIAIEKGENWEHDFSLPLGLRKRNAPQIAIWVEDEDGKYLTTIYVTHKIATQSWQMSGGNRRKEALPHWCYSRGVKYDDGLYLPTNKNPLPDAVSGATPKDNFEVKLTPVSELKRFVVKIEVNHSTDFNNAFPKSAKEGDANYSGGKNGSGQPALVYATMVDLSSDQKEFTAEIIGHSSPDGSNGEVLSDLFGITTALNIVKSIKISVK